jgi:hypothetical protein
MSRSFKKSPVSGWTTAMSEKKDKRLANRRLRKASGERIGRYMKNDLDALVMPMLREVSNVWGFSKDGKHYVTDPAYVAKALRK